MLRAGKLVDASHPAWQLAARVAARRLPALVRQGRVSHSRRYQARLSVADVFPKLPARVCRCGCGQVLPKGRRAWASDECLHAAVSVLLVLKGDSREVRRLLWLRADGRCEWCGRGLTWRTRFGVPWEADHIAPVERGGAACLLEGYQALCVDCHATKTAIDRRLGLC